MLLRNLRALAAATLIAVALLPSWAGMLPGAGRIAGTVLSVDGRPAAGYAVVLLDSQGRARAREATTALGSFSLAGIAPGTYRLHVEDAQGIRTPVVGGALEVAAGSELHRDVMLVPPATGAARRDQAVFGPRADSWWSRQTHRQKIFWWSALGVGSVVAVAAIANANDDDEAPASAFQP